MSNPTAIMLLHGLTRNAAPHGPVMLRGLTGREEMPRVDSTAPPAMQVTALLCSVVDSIGDISPVTPVEIRALTIGDRERLLFALYAATFGPEIETVASCTACGERIEVPIDLAALLAAGETNRATDFLIRLDGWELRFRLPNGGDHEAFSGASSVDPESAAAALRDRCVVSLHDESGREFPAEAMSADLQLALEQALRKADPQIDTAFALACPACGDTLVAQLDGFSLIERQVGSPAAILADVHRLARAYHWSEDAILTLPTARRKRYLALLDQGQAAA